MVHLDKSIARSIGGAVPPDTVGRRSSIEFGKFHPVNSPFASRGYVARNALTEPGAAPRAYDGKHSGDRVMSHKKPKSAHSPKLAANDLKDWAIIGSIIVSSSLLVWGPLLIG